MLNPSFPKSIKCDAGSLYVAPLSIINRTVTGNESLDSGPEYRLQRAFGNEIWLKLTRAGLDPEFFENADVLEVCAGTGFLTFHILERCRPKRFTVNDISPVELDAARNLVTTAYPEARIDWILGDMHTLGFGRKFDLIIGNSFIHHFHNVPKLLNHLASMLKKGGVFISLHEPSPMAPIVESGKYSIWPIAAVAPEFVNNILRNRFKGSPSVTDIWMFEASELRQVACLAGFKEIEIVPWGLFRPLVVQQNSLHLSDSKKSLSDVEISRFELAVRLDALLNRVLPQRCFGSICLMCRA